MSGPPKPSLFLKIVQLLGAISLVAASLIGMILGYRELRNQYNDSKDTNVVYFAPRSPNGVIIERSSWTNAELLHDALEIVAITDTGREYASHSWGRPFGLMKTWERAVNHLVCFVGLKDDDGRMSSLVLYDPKDRERERYYTFDFVGERTDTTNPYKDNHAGQFSINDIELVNVNGKNLVCLTVGDAIVPYPLVILDDSLEQELLRLWHPGAYASIDIITDVKDQTPYLLIVALNNRLSPWEKLPNAGDRRGHRNVIMAINLRTMLELEDDVYKGQGTVKHRAYIPSVHRWKDVTDGGGLIEQKEYNYLLKEIEEWIVKDDQLIQYRVFDEVFVARVSELSISRKQSLASVTYRRFKSREYLNKWQELKNKGEDHEASKVGESWFVRIQVVGGTLEVYADPEFKMRNLAEIEAVTLKPLKKPFKAITLAKLVETRIAESEREQGGN